MKENLNISDWNMLYDLAKKALEKSYSPYSKFPVGVAAITTTGDIVTGCNIENASYGLTLCAESSLIADLINSKTGKLLKFLCLDKNGNYLAPCGRCRQLLYEHAAENMLIKLCEDKIITIDELLPDAFGPKNLLK